MRPRHFQIFFSRSLPAKSLMELRWVLDVDSVVDGVPVVVDAVDGVLYGVQTKWIIYSSCMIPPCLWDVGCVNLRINVCLKFICGQR